MEQYPTGLGKSSRLNDVEWDDPQVSGREQQVPNMQTAYKGACNSVCVLMEAGEVSVSAHSSL